MSSRAMISATALVIGILVVPARADLSVQGTLQLETLTVPPSRLVPGCALSPAAFVRLDGNRTITGLWAGLAITTNPWSGEDRSIAVEIRERVALSPRLPDGPPLSRAQLARFRFELADDVERAYAAIYADDSLQPITVYAVRFKETPIPQAPPYAARNGDIRLVHDRTAVVLSGNTGPCSKAVGAYLAELVTP
jgi:hypothetical protein